MVHTSDRLSKVNLVGFLLLVSVLGEILMPVPACESVALAGGGCGLAHEALGVGHAHHGVVAVSELAAVGDVQNVDLVLLGVLNPLSVHDAVAIKRLGEVDLVGFLLLFGVVRVVCMPIPAGEGVALAGGGHRLAHEALGVGQTLLNLLAVSELAAVGDVRDVDLVLLLVLDPLSIDGSALLNGLGEIDLVGFLLLVGVVRVVCMPVPAGEGVALAGGRRRLTEHTVGIGNTLHGLVTVKELTAVGKEVVADTSALLRSIAVVALGCIVSESYCRHATESKRQAQACCYYFLRTWILHLFSFFCIILRPPHRACLAIHAHDIKQPSNKDSLRNIKHCIFLHNRYARGINRFVSSMRFFAFIYTFDYHK